MEASYLTLTKISDNSAPLFVKLTSWCAVWWQTRPKSRQHLQSCNNKYHLNVIHTPFTAQLSFRIIIRDFFSLLQHTCISAIRGTRLKSMLADSWPTTMPAPVLRQVRGVLVRMRMMMTLGPQLCPRLCLGPAGPPYPTAPSQRRLLRGMPVRMCIVMTIRSDASRFPIEIFKWHY